MADIANLVLGIDSTQVKTGTAALDELADAGKRAEVSTVGLGSGMRGASAEASAMATSVGASTGIIGRNMAPAWAAQQKLAEGFRGAASEASAMASAAQLSARSAIDQASGFGAATNAARLNTMAMRESLVVAREISRGNFTRLPGSLTLLAQGISSGGGLGAYAQALGLIKQVQNAELAEAAAATAASAAGVEAAARKAGASILAADTEVALAEAQLRTAETAGAEAAAQARLAAANQAVAAASAEAAIAENALAVAQGRAAETAAANAAASRTMIGATGVGLIGIAVAAGGVFAAFKQMQGQIRDNGDLTKFRDNLGLSHQEMLRLTDGTEQVSKGIKKLTDVTITFGDFAHGVFGEVGKEIGENGAWDKTKEAAGSAFSAIGHAWNVTTAALSAGLYMFQDIGKTIFDNFAAIVGNAFVSAVNLAIGAMNGLATKAASGINYLIHTANAGLGTKMGDVAAGNTSLMANPYAERANKALNTTFDPKAYYNRELARNNAAYAGIMGGAEASARKRMQEQADALKENERGKHPREKKENDHGLGEALAKLDAEIKGQYALAAAYQVSGAAAQRAIADQKAAEDAISHKGGLDQFRALELQKLVATDVAKQAKANEGLQLETSIRARLNGQIADGSLTIGQYNEQLKIQTTLRRLADDLENADVAHKQAVKDVIQQTIDLQKQQVDLESQLKLIEATGANNSAIERIRLENSLWNAGNKARAVALAQYDAMQKLKEIDPTNQLTRGERTDFVQSEINKATANDNSPFHQWAKGIPKDADDINTALQSIQVRGLDTLASSITGVVTGTESLGKAFKNVAQQIIGDIIQMTIKMLIFRAISSIFGSIGGGGSAPVGVTDPGALSPNFALPPIPGRAVGGPVSAGQTYLVGERGPELFTAGASGAITPNNQLAAYPNRSPANDMQRGPIEIRVTVDTSENLDTKVDAKVVQGMGQAVKISVDHTNSTIKALRRPGISGGR